MTRKTTAKTPEFIGEIAWIDRLKNSVNGNPRYQISFVYGPTRKTQPDAGISYGLTNPEYQDTELEVYTTPSGMVYDLRPIDHRARPDDDPLPGDRCKDCGREVTWMGPSAHNWLHIVS